MNKISIRLTSFLLAIFSYVLIFQNIVSNQEQIPLNTNEQFEINIANTLITKEELALELDKIVDTNNATLIKIATPTNDYENKKDIIYFGSKKPISNDLVVTGNKINWLDAKLTGELISSKNIGSRPLYGTYATDNNADFKHDIEQWAIENGIDIEWTATPSLLKDIYYNLVHNGVGNVILTAFLLFISSMIAWFVLRAKGRSIRLLGGVELNKIYKEDTLAISKLFIPSYITALFIFLLYIGVSRGIRQIPLVVTNSLIILVVLTVISLVVTYGMSIIVNTYFADAARNNSFNREQLQKGFNNIEQSDPIFADLFTDIDLYSNRLGAGDQKQSDTVASLIKEIDKADLLNSDAEILGNAYEYLIGQFASETGKKAGE